MVQRGEDLRLAAEAREALLIVRERDRQHLDRDVAVESRVARAEHLAHAARADRREDVVWSEPCAWRKHHGRW
jgi:hypothetical protein